MRIFKKSVNLSPVIRAWQDIIPEWEFRAFVYKNRLTACTQYYDVCCSTAFFLFAQNVFVPTMWPSRDQIKSDMFVYWDTQVKAKLVGKFPEDTYTVDFAYIPESKHFFVSAYRVVVSL